MATEGRRRRVSATGVVLVACAAVALLVVALPRKRRAPRDAPPPVADTRGDLDPAMLDAVVDALSPPAEGPEPTVDDLARRVFALGDDALRIVVALLCGEVDAGAVEDGSEAAFEVHPSAIELRPSALQAALCRFPAAPVVAELDRRCSCSSPMEVRVAAARLLGTVDHDAALPALLRTIDGIEPIQLARAYVREALEGALAAQLARRPEAIAGLALDARRRDASVLAVQARGAGRTATAASARFLARIAGRDPELDAVVAREIARLGSDARIAMPEDALDAVRGMLDDSQEEVRRASALAAGTLRDEGSFFALTEMLASGEPLVAVPARAALRAIAGADMGEDPEAWLAWREREFEWVESEIEDAFTELASGDPGRVSGAVAELTRHPFFRHDSAAAIAALVDHDDPAIARVACTALVALRSTRAIPWLVAAFDVADEERAELLRATLVALTGLDLPPDGEVWRRALAD